MFCQNCGKESKGYSLCYSCYILQKSKKTFNTKRKKLDIRLKITNYFCSYFQIDESILKGKTKTKELVNKRMLFIYVLYNYANITMADIGEYLNRDHTTISHALKSCNINLLSNEEKMFIQEIENIVADSDIKEKTSFYEKFESDYLCEDGHKVKSKSEREIDNYLYRQGIVHCYEKQYISVSGQTFYPDFYLPKYNLYLEYFGRNNYAYVENVNKKIKMFKEDKNINFEYLSYDDDPVLIDMLKQIINKYE